MLRKICAGAWLNWSVVHRLDEADVVHDLRQVRQHLGKLRAALPVLRELEPRPQHRRVGADERIALPADHRGRNRLALQLRQFRLVVEQVELARRARHEQMDDPLRLRRRSAAAAAARPRHVRPGPGRAVGVGVGAGPQSPDLHLGQQGRRRSCRPRRRNPGRNGGGSASGNARRVPGRRGRRRRMRSDRNHR